MLKLRTTIFYIGLILFTIPHTIIAPLFWLVPFKLRRTYLTLWSGFTLWWLKISCNLDYVVEGRENIPNDTSIILAKHQSTWETIAMQRVFPLQTWVLKRELLWIPFFGWGLAMTRPVAIDRSAGKKALKQVIDQGTNRLEQGIWVVVFPEGTRTPYGSRKSYAVGGAMLAAKSGFPVIPVAHNGGKYWPKVGSIKPGTITLSIGPAITTTDKKPKEINMLAENWIENRCQTL
ncbi:MAG: 1-acyl-sn-glycerol-3-phosphate acyltransferase [Gammaproteobacteria bacterium]|nr:1-acyl-sn-glycerol-3-phosphate acyltransferase [Gammaproteobacteria bacterium]